MWDLVQHQLLTIGINDFEVYLSVQAASNMVCNYINPLVRLI